MHSSYSFGQWIKQLRAEHDLTQEALAEQVGCAVQTLRAFESGVRRPSRAMAERFAQVLSVSPEQQTEFLRIARLPLHKNTVPAPAEVSADQQPTSQQLIVLPQPSSIFIGRETERKQVLEYLAQPQQRLITLLGSGGIGKTRLALQIGHDVISRFRDGVVFVDLAQVQQLDHVITTLAHALALKQTQQLESAVLHALHDREMLLILDNMEHLLEAAATLNRWLDALPHLTIMVTSRERLRLTGEWIIELEGLRVPPHNPLATRRERQPVERFDAVRLFVERARQRVPDFTLTAHNQLAIAHICRMLGGMPLGIELAASWVRMLTPAEIEAEIAQSTDFLTLADRDKPLRHQSMRAVFDHSWHLLEPQERTILKRLAVFRGSARREAIDAVCGDLISQTGQRTRLLTTLASLIDKSLVRRINDSGGLPRFSLHELIRHYALEKLALEAAEAEQAYYLHCKHFTWVLQDQVALLQTAWDAAVLQQLNLDADNIRQAWTWAFEHKHFDLLSAMAPLLTFLWDQQLLLHEGKQLFHIAAEALRQHHCDTQQRHMLGELLTCEAIGASTQSDVHGARSLFEQALELLEDAEPRLARLNVYGFFSLVWFKLGDYTQATATGLKGVELAQKYGYPFHEALAQSHLALAHINSGEYATAQTVLATALQGWRALKHPRGISMSLHAHVNLALIFDQPDQAEIYAHEMSLLMSEAKDQRMMRAVFAVLGKIALHRGDLAEAEYLLQESIELEHELALKQPDPWIMGSLLLGAADVAWQQQRKVQALQRLLVAWHQLRHHAIAPWYMAAAHIVALMIVDCDAEVAGNLWQYIAAHPATRADLRLKVQQLLHDHQRAQTTAAYASIDVFLSTIDEILAELRSQYGVLDDMQAL